MGHKIKQGTHVGPLTKTGSFIREFISALPELARLLGSISYKGTRFSTPEGYANFSRRKSYLGLKNLEHRGLIEKISDNRFRFTPAGLKWLSRNHARYFRYQYPKWDKKWRVIMFDIPKELHSARNRLRLKLKQLGCFMIQKSIFVFPYPCRQEISDICESLDLSAFVDVFETNSLGTREKDIRSHFHL